MSENKETYEDKIKLLFRAVRSPQFRFIVIQYNHFGIKKEISSLLQEKYPQRPSLHFDLKNINYTTFIQQIFEQGEGFVFLHDFEQLLENPDFYIGFNQRRDKFSKYPIYLIAFLSKSETYLQLCARRIPDMWSLRTLVLMLESNLKVENSHFILEKFTGLNIKTSLADNKLELERILKRISELKPKPENAEILATLYPQAIHIYKVLKEEEKGYNLAKSWLKIAQQLELNLHIIHSAYLDYSSFYRQIPSEKYNEILLKLEKILAFFQKEGKKEKESIVLGIIYHIYAVKGDKKLAIVYQDKYIKVLKSITKDLEDDNKKLKEELKSLGMNF